MGLKYKYIAIDFDNTIALDAYPNIGRLIPGARDTIIKIKEMGGKVIINTCRSGKHVKMVKEYLDANIIPYDKINENIDELIKLYEIDSRKISADLYIDDKCLLWQEKGGIVDWDIVNKLIFEENK